MSEHVHVWWYSKGLTSPLRWCSNCGRVENIVRLEGDTMRKDVWYKW